jgi:hypothetical protein
MTCRSKESPRRKIPEDEVLRDSPTSCKGRNLSDSSFDFLRSVPQNDGFAGFSIVLNIKKIIKEEFNPAGIKTVSTAFLFTIVRKDMIKVQPLPTPVTHRPHSPTAAGF